MLEALRLLRSSAEQNITALADATDVGLRHTLGFNSPNEVLLIEAAKVGNIARVRELVEQGVRFNVNHDWDGRNPLHWAARNGHIDTVNYLLELGIPLGAVDAKGNTPLHLAAKGGHTAVVNLFLRQGASACAKNFYGDTPLHLAALKGQVEVCSPLADALYTAQGAAGEALNLNVKNNAKEIPLVTAVHANHADVVRRLIELGANPFEKFPCFSMPDRSALDVAINRFELKKEGSKEVLDRMAMAIYPGLSPCHACLLVAVQSNSPFYVAKLLEEFSLDPADLDMVREPISGNTLLHLALMQPAEARPACNIIADLLNYYGATRDVENFAGRTVNQILSQRARSEPAALREGIHETSAPFAQAAMSSAAHFLGEDIVIIQNPGTNSYAFGQRLRSTAEAHGLAAAGAGGRS